VTLEKCREGVHESGGNPAGEGCCPCGYYTWTFTVYPEDGGPPVGRRYVEPDDTIAVEEWPGHQFVPGSPNWCSCGTRAQSPGTGDVAHAEEARRLLRSIATLGDDGEAYVMQSQARRPDLKAWLQRDREMSGG
jgi:hypothetical protein